MPIEHSGLRLGVKVALVSFALNYVWEMAQMAAYTDGAGQPFQLGAAVIVAHCLTPTLGDMLVITLTFLLGWLVQGRPTWITHLRWCDRLVVSMPLVLLAMVVEVVAVERLHAWGYSAAMPLVPLVRVGLLPTVQLALTALVTFRIVTDRSTAS